ncbi:MAG TPA: ABC transporter permease [Bryobacteraceae bacterium]|jgi:ABC-2 type transport system permease protein|nr:ABC transporter permease [Bryobacteraceae bacterium]
MPAIAEQGFLQRLDALIRKEFNQIRRDRRLAISLIVPPTLQLLLFGFALDATVSNLRLGVVDDSHTPESRELVATMSESRSFRLANTYFSVNDLGAAISRGDLDAGLVIPYDFARSLQRGRQANVQVLLNAVNANTAAIGQGYAGGIIQNYNRSLLQQGGIHAQFTQIAAGDVSRRGQVTLLPAFLFNPGLESSWFIVTGVFGVLLILNGSLIASTAMIKEREAGTVEQLLMTPAGTAEIIIAKITPLFLLLLLMVLFATALMKLVFRVPFHGSVLLVLSGAALCVLCGIGIGTFIATFTKSAQQSQLMSFFVNPPLASLSGALTPVEAMPHWMQPLTLANPIRHFGLIARGALLKGSGLDALWPNLLALALFTLTLLAFSVWRFRKQLG